MGKRQRNRERAVTLRKYGFESFKEFRKRKLRMGRAKATT